MIQTDHELAQILEFANEDIETVTIIFYIFRKLSRDVEDIKRLRLN